MNVWGWVGVALYSLAGLATSIELAARAAAFRNPAEEDSLEGRVQVGFFAAFWPVTWAVIAYVWAYSLRRDQLTITTPPTPVTRETTEAIDYEEI